MSEVVYKPVVGSIGYRVGTDGSVWTCLHKVGLGNGGGVRYEPGVVWRRLTPTPNKRGAVCVRLHGVRKYVHHIVLTAFVGPCPEGMEACHFPDNDSGNNSVDNLRWDSHQGNEADKKVHGTDNRGERNGQAKLDWSTVRSIRQDYLTGFSQTQLGKKYGVSRSQVGTIVRGEQWVE